ncbi:class I SAM-dependent methyltransferase [Flavobacteriaceae bacterium TP-CH-4]|uniref:Class I SAM-dependent methyltransferase n=1 Tax=Pelagihabitans pacificus TaxID=2696054 RepID=A0A967AQR7_9FLAO|nr:class I SAM-dependent methyltransferase [Pelagihabitans pacificus]NHF57800.1 class I SAM-dependent methyltransferase [Pelagihabitans pacificus]
MSKEKILAAYETLAVQYNALIDHKPHNAYYDRPNTLELIPAVKDQKILDAACGPGKYAEILLAEGAEVTGFDISPRMVALAKTRNRDQGSFFVHDMAQPLGMFENARFDTVICALAMHYIEDWNGPLQEFHRVLKPGGALVLSIEHPFFEYTYFQSERYFEIEPVKAVWKGFGSPVEVSSYRRPLEACLMPLINNGFNLDRIVEPKPVPEFEKFDPKHFKELNEFPAFMCLRAVRKG